MKARCLLAALCLPLLLEGQIGDSYADALKYFGLGRYDLAQARLERLLLSDRQCIECYELLARIAISTENDSLAADWYHQALAVEPENPLLLLQVGLAEQRLGQLQQAKLSIQESLRLSPANGEAHFSLGNVWFDMDSLEQAEWSYSAAIALDSSVANYHYQLGGVFTRTERPDSALIEFEAAYTLYPKYSMAYEQAAAILRSQQRWQAMVAVLELGLAEAAETRNTRYWLGTAYNKVAAFDRAAEILGGFVARQGEHLGARFRYGIALYEIGEYTLATEHLTLVSRALPDLLEARLYLGLSYTALENDSLALGVFDSLLVAHPGYYDAWVGKGDFFRQRDRLAQARQHYQSALRLEPERWEAYHRQGLLFYRQSDYLTAELQLFQAMIRNDSTSAVQLALGDVAAAVGEDDFAAYYYGQVVAARPQQTAARMRLVDALTRLKLYRSARRELIWFLYEDRNDEKILYRMAQLSFAINDSLRANRYLGRYLDRTLPRREEERLLKLIRTAPRDPAHHRKLGQHHLSLGNSGLARESFMRAVALGDTTLSVADYFEEGVGP